MPTALYTKMNYLQISLWKARRCNLSTDLKTSCEVCIETEFQNECHCLKGGMIVHSWAECMAVWLQTIYAAFSFLRRPGGGGCSLCEKEVRVVWARRVVMIDFGQLDTPVTKRLANVCTDSVFAHKRGCLFATGFCLPKIELRFHHQKKWKHVAIVFFVSN